jgi:hypothetical protein
MAYLGVNTLFFSNLLPTAVLRLRAISCCTYDLVSTAIALVLALSSALSFASLAYDGFSWGGTIIAGIASLCNFVAFGGTRFVGALNVIKLVRNSFDKDFLFQQLLIRQLEHLKLEFKEVLERELLSDKIIETEAVVSEFLQQFYSRAVLLGSNVVFSMPDKGESINNYLGTIFDICFAGTMIYFIFLYFGQKGFEGINIFCKLLSKGEASLDDLSLSSKIIIGFFPGASSAIFMFFSAFSLRHQCLKLKNILFKNPSKNSFILLLIFIAVSLAATSVYNPADAMVNNQTNIFSVSSKSITGLTLPLINCIGLGIAFFIFTTLQAFPHQPNVKQIHDTSSTIQDVITWLEKHKLTHETIDKLRSHAFCTKYLQQLENEPIVVYEQESNEREENELDQVIELTPVKKVDLKVENYEKDFSA